MENTKICQSCGMPLDKPELFGKNADGTANDEYCCYCFPNGAFNNPGETMGEAIESCVPFIKEAFGGEDAAREHMRKLFPTLKRWSA